MYEKPSAPSKSSSSTETYRNRWLSLREDQYYLVNQYRYPAKAHFWEFPHGSLDTHDDAVTMENVARIELAEETGINAGHFELIGIVHEAYGYATSRDHIFLASELHFGQTHPELLAAA